MLKTRQRGKRMANSSFCRTQLEYRKTERKDMI
nr:MAG TPA: hypothetical protein [Caudoviricetes sp.]